MKAAWIAFIAIFLAELGDKTQLALLVLKGKGLSGIGIFFGAMIAFTVLTALAILLGGWLSARVPQEIMNKVAASAFILIGGLMWFGKV